MDLGLKGKVILITGTASQIGYGKGEALALAREGCDIIGIDKDIEGAEKTAAEVKALGVKTIAIKADVRNRDEVDNAVKVALEQFGKIDVLVNTAGAASPNVAFAQRPKEAWEFDIQTNFYGQMNVAQAVIPHMISRKSGIILNFSGGQGTPGNSTYGASKAAVDAWTHSLAKELVPLGIMVNLITPGVGKTGLGGGADKLPPGFFDRILERSPFKRLCTPEDMGRLMVFACSNLTRYMYNKNFDYNMM
ncbi:SDR family NAD(P)-dependent oxidoreductase [Chloroflexota bacterium]